MNVYNNVCGLCLHPLPDRVIPKWISEGTTRIGMIKEIIELKRQNKIMSEALDAIKNRSFPEETHRKIAKEALRECSNK